MAKKLYIENIVESPAALLYDDSTNAPSGFTDYTSDLSKWNTYGIGAEKENGEKVDYKVMRDNLKGVLFTFLNPDFSNWATVDVIVREMACKYFFAPYSLRVPSVQTEEQDSEYFLSLYRLTKGIDKFEISGRPRILEEMWEHVALNYYRNEAITQEQSTDFTLSTQELAWRYLNYSSSELKDWLSNTGDYVSTGFNTKPYYSDQLRDELLNIYIGNY